MASYPCPEVEGYQSILQRWIPGLEVHHALATTARDYYPQYTIILKRFENRSAWPSDLLSQIETSESMQFFYPGESIM